MFLVRWAVSTGFTYILWMLYDWANTQGTLLPVMIFATLPANAWLHYAESKQRQEEMLRKIRDGR